MKKLLMFFCLSLFLFSAHIATAKCANCVELSEATASSLIERIYLVDNQILFRDSKILVEINGMPHVVPAIYSDEKGYYILVKQPRGRCEPYEWKCRRCGTCNEFSESYCINCETEME